MNKYLKEAIEQYEQKIESGEPFYMDASVLMDIEDYYEKEGKSYDAERLMRFAEKLHPDSEDVLVVKAYRLKLSGKWSEALSLIKSIPNQLNRDVQLFYAEWDVASGRPQKAETRIASCLPAQITMEDYDWYLDFAEILLDYGFQKLSIKYLSMQGMECCKTYIQECPNDYSLRMYLGEQLYSLKQNKDALRFLQDALRLCPLDNPDHARIITDMVYTLIAMEQYDNIKDLMLRLCMLNTPISDVYIQLASIYMEFHNVEKIIETLDELLSLPSTTSNDCMNIAQLLAKNNFLKETPSLWRKLIAQNIDSEHNAIYAYAAYALFLAHDKDNFYKAMEKAISSKNPLLLNLLGNHFQTFDLTEIISKIEEYFEGEK